MTSTLPMPAARPRPPFDRGRLLVHLAALSPIALAWWDARQAAAAILINPVQAVSQRSGFTALSLLVATLAVTPLGALLGRPRLVRHRRTLGLYAFAWAMAHASITLWDFSWIEGAFDWASLKDAVIDKPYALVGFTSFCLLLPLAVTSTKGWMRRLGRRWTRLHRLIYGIAPLVVLHYLWSVKADWRPPAAFGAGVALLLALRLPALRRRAVDWGRRRRAARP